LPLKVLPLLNDLHTLSPTSRHSLNQNRVGNLVGASEEMRERLGVGGGGGRGVPAGYAGDAGGEHDFLRLAVGGKRVVKRIGRGEEGKVGSVVIIEGKETGGRGRSTYAFDPIDRIALAGGPMNVIPFSSRS
jgi:hypothetical protein